MLTTNKFCLTMWLNMLKYIILIVIALNTSIVSADVVNRANFYEDFSINPCPEGLSAVYHPCTIFHKKKYIELHKCKYEPIKEPPKVVMEPEQSLLIGVGLIVLGYIKSRK